MEKITLKALELAGFKDANTIAKIISYVPNPQVAAEMLLGVYTPRTVIGDTHYRKSKYENHKKLMLIISYDDLGNTVTCLQYTRNTKQGWYITKEDKEKNNITFEKPKGDYYSWDYIPVPGYTKNEITLDVSNFESEYCETVPTTEALRMLQVWDGILELEAVL